MATANITIDQPTHTTTPKGSVGRARNDLELGEPVICRNADDTDVTRWRWQMRDQPLGSTATLSDPTAAQVTFTPDVEGSYRITLTINDGLAHQIDTKIAAVETVEGFRYPATGEQATEANWLVSGSTNDKGWGKDVEDILRQAVAGTETLAQTLVSGNATGGTNISISTGDSIVGQGGGSIAFDVAGEIGITPTSTATVTGDLVVSGKLTVGGLIDPTGLVLDEQAAVPFVTAAGKGTVWVKNTVPNELWFTGDDGVDQALTGSGAVESLASTLVAGNSSSGTNVQLTNGDSIVGEDGGSISFVAVTGDIALAPGAKVTVAGDIELASGETITSADGGTIAFDGSGNIAMTPTATATCTGAFVATTSVQTPLVFAADFGAGSGAGTAITVRGGEGGTTGGAGGALTVRGGAAQAGNAAGGAAAIAGGAGAGTSAGGAASLTGGTGGASSGAGGAASLVGGSGGGSNANGGNVAVTGGTPTGTGAPGDITITGAAAVSGNVEGGDINITAGAGIGSGGGGDIVAAAGAAGTGTGAGGDVSITAGAGGTTSGTGGVVTIASGAPSASGSDGGSISITAANGSGAADGGAITISAGDGGGTATAIGGSVTINGGDGRGPGLFFAGAINLNAGDGLSDNCYGADVNLNGGDGNGSGDGGDIALTAGTGGATTGDGGNISLTAGPGGGGDCDGGNVTLTAGAATGIGVPGDVSITAGAAATGNVEGGDITLTCGAGVGTGTGGDFTVAAGAAGTGAASGGDVSISAGAGGSTSGSGGSITLNGGDATAGNSNGGSLQLVSGDATGTGTAGNIVVTSGTGGADVGVFRIANTCIEMAEAAAVPGSTITAGYGRFWVEDQAPSHPMFTDDTDVSGPLLRAAHFPTQLAPIKDVVAAAAVNATAVGPGTPTAAADILNVDWVDPTSSNVGSAPSVSSYAYSTLVGAGATLSLPVLNVTLDTSGCTVGDVWYFVIDSARVGLMTPFAVEIIV